MEKQWTEDDCLRLIEMYRASSVLWDPKHAGYYKKSQKEDAWNEISAVLYRSVDQIKNKMLSLLASYRREKSKIMKSSGKDPSEAYTSKWFAYEALCFLEYRPTKQRVNTENLEGSYVDEEVLYTEESDDGAQDEIHFEQRLTTPSSHKRMKREELEPEDNSYVPVVLKPATARVNNHSRDNDEVAAFFNYVAVKVRNYSLTTWRGVERDIFEVLVKADRGHYE